MASLDKALCIAAVWQLSFIVVSRLQTHAGAPSVRQSIPFASTHTTIFNLSGIILFAIVIWAIFKILQEKQ